MLLRGLGIREGGRRGEGRKYIPYYWAHIYWKERVDGRERDMERYDLVNQRVL
jgi:hypothetical protein